MLMDASGDGCLDIGAASGSIQAAAAVVRSSAPGPQCPIFPRDESV